MATLPSTPGVYIEEKTAFSSSINPVPTAIPAFIGYTEKALSGRKSLFMKPKRIGSLVEFERFFGKANRTQFNLTLSDAGDDDFDDPTLLDFSLAPVDNQTFLLYQSMKLFYENGGGDCWVVSVGDYGGKTLGDDGSVTDGEDPGVKTELLEKGVDMVEKIQEPTMLVVPDAVLLTSADECGKVQKKMIGQAGKLRDRFAILDVYDGTQERSFDEEDVINIFRTQVGTRNLDFGAGYYPWLHTNVTPSSLVSLDNLTSEAVENLAKLLTREVGLNANLELVSERRATDIRSAITELEGLDNEIPIAAKRSLSLTLSAVSVLYNEVMKDIRDVLNLLPPSGAVAGVYTYTDNSFGVARSPANISLNSVVAPTLAISEEDQEDLNIPLQGKAVNAIRTFPNKGILIWGARTLDGNSRDWRYVSVRRAIIMIEQSVKIALGAFVFEPNTQNTWLDVQSSINSFLTTQWNNGVLMGTTPSEAFKVDVGLGITMTPQDILDGIMRISVKLAVVRPAEFIIVTFEQQMPGGE